MKTPEKRIVNLEDRPDLVGLVEHVCYSYLGHSVEIRRDGQAVTVLLDPEAARCALAIEDRLRNARPPFTHDALGKWLDEVPWRPRMDLKNYRSGTTRPLHQPHNCSNSPD